MIFVDSNVIIGYLNGDEAIVTKLTECRSENRALFISSITVAEVLSLSTLSEKDIRIIDCFLSSFIVVQTDKNIAVMASAVVHDVPLATRDKKILRIKDLATVTF